MDLGPLLDAHHPTDAHEAEHLAGLSELWTRLGISATRRTTYDPGHFTASALVLAPDRSAVALVHHLKLGIWVQPGGHIEADDVDAEAAARREAAEEVGLGDLAPLGLIDVDVHAIPARPDEPAHRHYDLRFGFVAATSGIVAGDGTSDARWVALDDLDTYRPDAGLRRAVTKLRS